MTLFGLSGVYHILGDMSGIMSDHLLSTEHSNVVICGITSGQIIILLSKSSSVQILTNFTLLLSKKLVDLANKIIL